MKLKIGDKVRIVKCIDKSNPIEKRYMNRRGIITLIDESYTPSIKVMFDDNESFWPEELEKIR